MVLTTPEAVIHRAGVTAHPEYEDVSPMTDCAGFYAFRRYPSGTELADVLTNDGRPAVRCYLAFIVDAPSKGSHISRVLLKAWLARRWTRGRVFTTGQDPYQAKPRDPDAPTEDSARLLARARTPIDLDSTDGKGYIYDSQEGTFFDEDGHPATPVRILEEMYTKHCRTLGLWFRIRWNIGTAARWLIRETVWKGQDVATWALFRFYDVELIDDKKDMRFSFFYKYKPSDFRRITDKPNERVSLLWVSVISEELLQQSGGRRCRVSVSVLVGSARRITPCDLQQYGVEHRRSNLRVSGRGHARPLAAHPNDLCAITTPRCGLRVHPKGECMIAAVYARKIR